VASSCTSAVSRTRDLRTGQITLTDMPYFENDLLRSALRAQRLSPGFGAFFATGFTSCVVCASEDDIYLANTPITTGTETIESIWGPSAIQNPDEVPPSRLSAVSTSRSEPASQTATRRKLR